MAKIGARGDREIARFERVEVKYEDEITWHTAKSTLVLTRNGRLLRKLWQSDGYTLVPRGVHGAKRWDLESVEVYAETNGYTRV